MGITGLPSLDYVVEPLRRSWILEFYGGEETIRLVYHHVIAEASRHGRVAVVHVQEFGGLNPYLIMRLARVKGGVVDNIIVSRAFRLRDVPRLILEALKVNPETIVVVDPYLYAPKTWISYHRLTPITGALREASKNARVVVANRVTRFGSGWLPEGGGFHHHTVHVIVRLQPVRKGVLAILVKHPSKRVPLKSIIPRPELVVGWRWGGQRPLLEYL